MNKCVRFCFYTGMANIICILGHTSSPEALQLANKGKQNTPAPYQFAVGTLSALNAKNQDIPLRAQIYRSTDGGQHWEVPQVVTYPDSSRGEVDSEPVIQPENTILTSVACLPSRDACIAGGYSGVEDPRSILYATTNAGDAWFGPIRPPLPQSLVSTQIKDVSYSKKGYRCLAVGEAYLRERYAPKVGIAYRSSDCINWNTPPAVIAPEGHHALLHSVSCSESGLYCLAVGLQPDTFELFSANTEDYGKTWRITTPPRPYRYSNMGFSAVSCSDSGMACVAVGYITEGPFDEGTHWPISYTSTDGGTTWKAPVFLSVPTVYNETTLSGVTCDSEGNQCIAFGMSSAGLFFKTPIIYKTLDAGLTWSLITPGTISAMQQLNDISCNEHLEHCTLVGSHASGPVSYSSLDGGNTWRGPFRIKTPEGFKESQVLGAG
ncbi:MAG: sialidase family protein [Legionellaceae bacterium]|nr:sialidase family protein [Legionellaceae bacterium]